MRIPASSAIANTLKKSKVTLRANKDDVEAALAHHLRGVENWSSEISFADLRNPKVTADVFVPLNVYLHPRRRHVTSSEAAEAVSFEDLLGDTLKPEPLSIRPSVNPPAPKHLIILGQPGAGKTTSTKHLCQRILHEADFLNDQINLPLLVRLRDVNPSAKGSDAPEKFFEEDFLLSFLQDIVGLRITFPDELAGDENKSARRALRDRILIDFLDSLKALIMFDGFDEIVAKSRKDAVISQLRTLARQLDESRIIVTSRTGEFHYHIENMAQFELTPLTESQIETFVTRWLGHDDGEKLIAQIERSPYNDTAIRPLTIAHLCAIYEKAGRIPDKPKTVYKKIVNLLLEEWDGQRPVKRESAYANFEIDRKSELLAKLAFSLTMYFPEQTEPR